MAREAHPFILRRDHRHREYVHRRRRLGSAIKSNCSDTLIMGAALTALHKKYVLRASTYFFGSYAPFDLQHAEVLPGQDQPPILLDRIHDLNGLSCNDVLVVRCQLKQFVNKTPVPLSVQM